MQGRPDQRWSGRFALAREALRRNACKPLASNVLAVAFRCLRREEDEVRSDGQPAADRRTTVLVPEAVMPHQPGHRARWGLWAALLLAGMAAGIMLAWSLGLVRSGANEDLPTPAVSEAMPPPMAPRSPYPDDLPDLSGRATVPIPDLPPVVPPPVEETRPPRIEPAPSIAVAAPIPAPAEPRRVAPPKSPAAAPTPTESSRAIPPKAIERPPSIRRATVTPSRPSLPVTRPSVAIPARSLSGPLPALFAPGDYPPASRRAGEQGDVTVRLTISPFGRVTRCAVLASNASDSLESATCAVLSRRARFAPAVDASGIATGGAMVQHIAWRPR